MSLGEFSGVVIGNKVGNKKPLVPSSLPSVPETLDSKPKSRSKMFSTKHEILITYLQLNEMRIDLEYK